MYRLFQHVLAPLSGGMKGRWKWARRMSHVASEEERAQPPPARPVCENATENGLKKKKKPGEIFYFRHLKGVLTTSFLIMGSVNEGPWIIFFPFSQPVWCLISALYLCFLPQIDP